MVLNGTAGQLDAAFFDTISAPAKSTSGLYTNMEAHLKTVEEAKKASKMETDAKIKEQKAKTAAKNTVADEPEVPAISREEMKRIYEEAMKKVNELGAQMKYGEAMGFLPSVEDYPEKKAEIEKKMADLQKMKEMLDHQRSLFND